MNKWFSHYFLCKASLGTSINSQMIIFISLPFIKFCMKPRSQHVFIQLPKSKGEKFDVAIEFNPRCY